MTSKIFMSAELSTLSHEENTRRTALLMRDLFELTSRFMRVDGAYNGVKERSFMIDDDAMSIYQALEFASKYGQESILHVNDLGEGRLWFTGDEAPVTLDGKFQSLGEVPEVMPLNYTKIDNEIFTIK